MQNKVITLKGNIYNIFIIMLKRKYHFMRYLLLDLEAIPVNNGSADNFVIILKELLLKYIFVI